MLVLVLIVLLFIFFNPCEGFTTKPHDRDKPMYAKKILQNIKSFDSYKNARIKLDFMDPVLYEDVRKLIRSGSISEDSLIQVL